MCDRLPWGRGYILVKQHDPIHDEQRRSYVGGCERMTSAPSNRGSKWLLAFSNVFAISHLPMMSFGEMSDMGVLLISTWFSGPQHGVPSSSAQAHRHRWPAYLAWGTYQVHTGNCCSLV